MAATSLVGDAVTPVSVSGALRPSYVGGALRPSRVAPLLRGGSSFIQRLAER
jgi:hypothetical protein